MTREYKDSGIEWIGRIPREWKACRFKYAGSFEKGKLPAEQNIEQKGLPIIGASEMLGKEPRLFTLDNVVPICKKEDILILWDGANAGIVANGCEGVVSSTTVKYDCNDSQYNKQFVFYLLKYYENYFRSKVGGTTIPHMNQQYINDCICLLPSLFEQQRIAEYLDEKCGEIEGLIALQEQMIEKLTDYKQSVITEAVTKGLNPDVQLVPSDIDCIGDVPKGWNKCAPLKWFTEIILGKMLQSNANSPTDTLEKYICAKDVHFDGIDYSDLKSMYYSPSEKGSYQVQRGDMLVVEGGAGAAGAAIIDKDIENTYIQNSIMIVRPKRNIDIRYARYVLFSIVSRGYVDYICNKATIPHFTKDKLSGTVIPMPSFAEQRAIADYLDTKCSEIDRLIKTKRQKIEKLKEYKKSVIYEAVTGKTIIE